MPPTGPYAPLPASAPTPPRPGVNIIRPAPASAGPSSFDAIAMKSVLSRARDASRFEAPEVEEDATRTRRPFPLRALLTVLVGVAVLGVLAGVVYVTFFREVKPDDQTIVSMTATASNAHITTPQEVVQGYLDALAAGDIETALTFGPPGGDGSAILLTPENHQKMATNARPTNVTILTDDPLATEVEVSYTLAGQDVSTAMRVTRQDDGSYRLARTTVTILTQVSGGANLPMLINGVEVDHSRPMEVVPGTYAISTGLPFISYPDTNSITIQSLAYTDTTVFPVNPQLTDAGRTALFDRAQASLAACLAQRELTPTGCPNAIRAPKPIVVGSPQWRLLNDPWQTFNPSLKPDDQTIGTATVTIRTRVTMTYTDGRTSGNNDQNRSVRISANLLGKEPADVTIVWDR